MLQGQEDLRPENPGHRRVEKTEDESTRKTEEDEKIERTVEDERIQRTVEDARTQETMEDDITASMTEDNSTESMTEDESTKSMTEDESTEDTAEGHIRQKPLKEEGVKQKGLQDVKDGKEQEKGGHKSASRPVLSELLQILGALVMAPDTHPRSPR